MDHTWVLVWLGMAVGVGLLAKAWKGRSPIIWSLIGLSGLVGLILLMIMPTRAPEKAQEITGGEPG